MKIIKDCWTLLVECLNCGVSLEIDEKDVNYTFYDGEGDSYGNYIDSSSEYMVKCPKCKNKILIDIFSIPNLVRSNIEARSIWGDDYTPFNII